VQQINKNEFELTTGYVLTNIEAIISKEKRQAKHT
jgi:hypothetical protein